MHNPQLMYVLQSLQQLSNDLNYLFFLENAKFLLEIEERIFCELHHHIDMRFCGVDVVEGHDVGMREVEEDFDLTNEVLADLEGMLFGDRFLGEKHLGLFILHQVDKGMSPHSDRLNPEKEILFGLLFHHCFLLRQLL